jgi:hypothetical protein
MSGIEVSCYLLISLVGIGKILDLLIVVLLVV